MLNSPFKRPHPVWMIGSIMATLAGIWLVFWPPGTSAAYLLAGPLIGLGSAVAAAQFALSRSLALERQVAPAELQAWLVLAVLVAILAVSLGHADLLQEGFGGPGASQPLIMLILLLTLYVVLSTLLRARQATRVVTDERDLQIAARAVSWGRTALIGYVVVLVVMLGYSPAQNLVWASPPVIAFHLLLVMCIGWAVEHLAVVMLYWRDRR